MVKKYKQKRKQDRAKIARSLATTTKGGTGLISKRPGYKKHVGKKKKK